MGTFALDISGGGMVAGAREHIVMGSVLALSLAAAITLLLVTHLFFTFASQTSVESGMLIDFNPFF